MGLKIEKVSKSFSDKVVVDDISFELEKPGVFGLLGTNGAGKTTTIRMILGILERDSGDISWNGKKVTRRNVNFGYLPEERGIYPKTKVKEQLIYFAKLKGIKQKDAEESLKKWAGKFEIEEYLNMPAEKLSKGNQQKVQFLTAVMHNPDLIILDEPFSGLDPINTNTIKDILQELINEGKHIIMSSHQMSSVEEFCNDILIMNRSKTIIKGNLQEIKDKYEVKKIYLDTSENRGYTVDINSVNEGEDILKSLLEKNIIVNEFKLIKPSLHDIFVEKVGGVK